MLPFHHTVTPRVERRGGAGGGGPGVGERERGREKEGEGERERGLELGAAQLREGERRSGREALD